MKDLQAAFRTNKQTVTWWKIVAFDMIDISNKSKNPNKDENPGTRPK